MANKSETHEEVCEEMRSFGDMPPPMFAWRDLAERAESAHRREIEIASKYSAEHEARTFNAIRKRDALITELADALNLAASHTCYTSPVNVSNFRKLIAKAREVCNA